MPSVSRGDVVLLPIAFVSGQGTKVRPAVVVQNDNGGSGSYTLYRDTAVPSGTVAETRLLSGSISETLAPLEW